MSTKIIGFIICCILGLGILFGVFHATQYLIRDMVIVNKKTVLPYTVTENNGIYDVNNNYIYEVELKKYKDKKIIYVSFELFSLINKDDDVTSLNIW